MENKVLEENIDLIKKYDSNLANKILMFKEEKSNLEICKTQEGEYNLVYRGCCLHSQKGAIKEAKDIASKVDEEENSIRVIFGLGLGYVVEEISNKIKKSKIIVYEPALDIIHYVLSIAKIDSLYKNNVFLCNDKETLAEYVLENTDNKSKMKLIYTKSYKEIFPNEFNEILQTIQTSQGQHSANVNTVIKKAPQALNNTYANLKKVLNLPYIMQYKDIYKGKTALIISAGPSLKDNIETIKNNKDKFVIFCVNVAMEYVINSGIEPDFIIDIEAAGADYQYKDIDISNSYLILEPFSHYLKYDIQAKKVITYISKNNFLNGWLRSGLEIDDNLETMGTVSYTALDCAYIMGFDKIILIGQDLAYKDGQCYAKGSRYEDLECVFDEKQNKYVIQARDFEKYAQKLLGKTSDAVFKYAKKYIANLNKNIYTIKSQNNTYLPTQAGYALFVEWFEKVAQRYKKEKPDIKLINSSTGGAQINGFENVCLIDAVKNSEKIEKYELSNCTVKYRKEVILNKIKEHLEGLYAYDNYAKDVQKYCEKFLNELKTKKVITSNALKYMKKHNDSLNMLLNYQKNQDWRIYLARFSYLILPLIEEDFSKDITTTKETMEKLLKIYNNIVKTNEFAIQKLTDCESFVLQ